MLPEPGRSTAVGDEPWVGAVVVGGWAHWQKCGPKQEGSKERDTLNSFSSHPSVSHLCLPQARRKGRQVTDVVEVALQATEYGKEGWEWIWEETWQKTYLYHIYQIPHLFFWLSILFHLDLSFLAPIPLYVFSFYYGLVMLISYIVNLKTFLSVVL